MDIILLVYLTWQLGNKARTKGLDVFRWRLRLVLTWIVFEFAGGALGILLFGYDLNNMLGLAAFSLACAFGGYLLVKARFDKINNNPIEEDINNTGNQ